MIKNGRFGGLSCNVPKRRKDNASLVYIDSTTILNMLSSKSILKNKKTVERLSGLRYIILAKFKASFMGDFERIQNLPFPRVACLLHGNSSPWSFFPFMRVAVSSFDIPNLCCNNPPQNPRNQKIKESTSLLCQAALPTRCDTLREGINLHNN